MSPRYRYGLRTMTLTSTAVPQVLREQLRTGRRTAAVRPLSGPRGQVDAVEEVGQRLLLLDEGGCSLAVVEVLATRVAAFRDVEDVLRLADDPDVADRRTWMRERRQAWTDAGHRLQEDFPVLCLTLRVIGLEE